MPWGENIQSLTGYILASLYDNIFVLLIEEVTFLTLNISAEMKPSEEWDHSCFFSCKWYQNEIKTIWYKEL